MVIVTHYEGYDNYHKRIDLHERSNYKLLGKFFDEEDLESEFHAMGYSDYEIANMFIKNEVNAFRTGIGNEIIVYMKESLTMLTTIEFTSNDEFLLSKQVLEENPDFHDLGYFDSISSLINELSYQGLTVEELKTYSRNRYGRCLEILETDNGTEILAFIGER